MSSESNSNSKFHSTASVAEVADLKENNNSFWDSHRAIQELKNFEIDPVNNTLTKVLKEIHQVEKKYFDRYDKLRGYLPLAGFYFSRKYLEIQNIKNYLNELALWLYNEKSCKMPSSLQELIMNGNNTVSLLNNGQTTVEYHVIDMANWIFEFSALSDEALIEKFNRGAGLKYWGLGRSRYTSCLKNEILDRTFNSEVLFERNSSGNVIAFKLGKKVRLLDGVLIIDN